MRSTMQDYPLTITALMRHGLAVHGESEVATFDGSGCRRARFVEIGERAERLAAGLRELGVRDDDRVGTFQWNNQEHLEAYLAVPAMGAVLHTLNIRLYAEQLAYVANHAQDKVLLVDASLVEQLAAVLPEMTTVEHVVVVGDADRTPLEEAGRPVHSYDELLAAQEPGFSWSEPEEHAAAAMCYTSGTTGNPKGAVYSHRSAYLHSMAMCMGNVFGIAEVDRVLPIVPMFHANAWGLPYAAWIAGADLVMPDRFLQAEPLGRLISAEGPTVAGGVPTVWNDLLAHAAKNQVDFSSLRLVLCGGSAVPLALMQRFEEQYGVRIVQAWGMTETSPVAAVASPPKQSSERERWQWRSRTGRLVAGVECRIVGDDGTVLAADGVAVGEFQVRGPWVIAGYYRDDDPAKFDDGWLRTGDVGTLDGRGFMQITDRSKDVIKSGGEWISSVELENELMAHRDVLEAAVVGVPDEKWGERPLACVVAREGATIDLGELREFLGSKVARWMLPDRWAVIDEVPRTSVGKFDKKVLRAREAEGALEIQQVGRTETKGR